MAVYSTTTWSRLERAKRTDAEYYQPKYLSLNELYKRGRWLPIRKHLALCEYGISIKMNVDGIGYPIFRMDNLKNGFATDDEMKFAPISPSTFEAFHLEPDDILFNRVNSEEFVGRTGIFKLRGEYVFASYLVRARTNETLSPDVLNLFLNCKYGILSIRRLSRRAVNQANVNAQELKSILIPQFSDDLQRELTRLSNRSWNLYADAKEKYTRAEKLLLSELGLQDWQPQHTLTYVRQSSESVRSQRLDAEHFQPKYDEIISKIVQCQPRKLSALAKQVIETIDFDLQKIYRYIEISDVNTNTGEIGFTERIVKDLPPNAKIKVSGGELIVSKVRPTRGAVGIVPAECQHDSVCSGAFSVFDVASPTREFLQVFLRSSVGKALLEKPCRGTSYPTIDDIDVKSIPVPTIKQPVIEEIAALVQQSHAARREAKQLLERAKRAVEIAIEESETAAVKFLQDNQ